MKRMISTLILLLLTAGFAAAYDYHMPVNIRSTMTPAVLLPGDEAMLVIDKPEGIAVHGGSGVSFGVIEALRRQRPQAKFLELAHRLDRETSGVLLVGKKRRG